MKRVIKLLCILLAASTLAGCTQLSSFLSDDLPKLVYKITSAIDGSITTLEQTDVVISEERFDISSYSRLSTEQKRIYRILLTVTERMPEGWIKLGKSGENYNNDIVIAYRALLNDCPAVFWMPTTYLLSNIGSDSSPDVLIAFEHETETSSCSYTVTKAERDTMKAELEAAAEKIAEEAVAQSGLFEAELYIHDTLCETVEYFEEGDELIYTAYGALVSKKAVCSGYARAFQLICDNIGLPCVPVYGLADGESHMWNQINLGSGWYNVDVTWDDTDELMYTYFNIPDSELEVDHTIWELYDTSSGGAVDKKETYNLLRYKCSSTEEGYFEYRGHILDGSFSAAADAIIAANKTGSKSIQLKITDQATLADFETDYNSPSAKLQMRLDMAGSGITLQSVSLYRNIVVFYW